MKPLIDFQHITVDYGSGPVLRDITLSIGKGEHTVILGANGSGKSTLMKLFSNDLYPSAKYPYTKSLFGKERWAIWDLKKKLGIITHDLHHTFAHQAQTVNGRDLVISGFHSSLGIFSHQGITEVQKQHALEAMQELEVGYLADRNVREMSTGQLRRCIIARAMVHHPEALLLDEPTSGLDIKAQLEFVQMIRKLSKVVTIILITHHIEEIFEEISKVVLLKSGKIFKAGKKKVTLTDQNLSDIFDIPLNLALEEGIYRIQKRY